MQYPTYFPVTECTKTKAPKITQKADTQVKKVGHFENHKLNP